MVDFQQRETRRGTPDTNETNTNDSTEMTSESESESASAGSDHHAHHTNKIGVAIVTVSSSRTLEDDPSGDTSAAAVKEAGHEVVTREIVTDSRKHVQSTLKQLMRRSDADVIITTGGTGVSPDDVTIEAIDPLLAKTLPGFGEIFRRKSAAEIGTRVIGNRATAGIGRAGVVVFALPGSLDAVELGVEDIILPEMSHLTGLAQRGLGENEK